MRKTNRIVTAFALALALWSAPRLLAQPQPVAHPPFAKAGAPKRPERVRTFDVQHIKGELTLDAKKSELRGSVTHTLTPMHPRMKTLTFDCGPKLKVSSVTVGSSSRSCEFEHKDSSLKITLDRPYDPGETIAVSIAYSGSPKRGMYFIPADPSDPVRQLTIWTHGEPDEQRDWLPCYDYPNDRATSEMIVTVEKPLFVVSNGALIDTKDEGKTRTFHWKMDVPHVSYLISLAVSDFGVHHDKLGDLPVDYYASKGFDEATVRRALGKTPRMIDFFNKKIGEPYAYPKYAQVAVPEFTWGGQENISATTLFENVFRDAISELEGSQDGLVAHELAHQWFGDLLTCRDWSHLWLNEGFASYFDPLYMEHDKGEDAFRIAMANSLRGYIGGDRGQRRPIVESRYEAPIQLFDGVAYAKGACVLHALRGVLGDEAWWAGIRRYVRDNKGKVVETDDLRKAMEAASNQDLAWFFNQWTAKAGHPELRASWRYETADKTVRFKVEQVQKLDEQTPLFRLPTTLEISDGDRDQSIPIVIDGATHEFIVPWSVKPRMVRIDPKGWLLKEIVFDKPADEWIYQLAHAPDVLDRLDAARSLGKLKDNADAGKALASAWSKEKSTEARSILVGQLGEFGESARTALREAAKDKEARVRVAALNALGRLKRDDDLEALFRSTWSDDKEAYGARQAALQALVNWKVKDKDALLASALKTPSDRDRLASYALRTILDESGPSSRQTAVLSVKPGRSQGMRMAALFALGRLVKDDAEVQDALIACIDDPSRNIRSISWNMLANAEVKRALPALEARLPEEQEVVRGQLEGAIRRLKASAAGTPTPPATASPPAKPAVDPAREIDNLLREANELELRSKEDLNRAEALRLKAERLKTGTVSTK